MTPNTPEDVSDERLAELIRTLDRHVASWDVIRDGHIYVDAAKALRQLQRHRAENNELDAKRYRWLREDNATELGEPWCVTRYQYDATEPVALIFDKLDEAIDSAMSNASEEGR
jgi:hypothetical protein